MKKFLFAALLSIGSSSWAQQRPRLLGISHIALRVHDLQAARQFYGDLFGYQEAFTILKDNTAVVRGGLPSDAAARAWGDRG